MGNRKYLQGYKSYKQASEATGISEAELRKLAVELYKANRNIKNVKRRKGFEGVVTPKTQSFKSLTSQISPEDVSTELTRLKNISKASTTFKQGGYKILYTPEIKESLKQPTHQELSLQLKVAKDLKNRRKIEEQIFEYTVSQRQKYKDSKAVIFKTNYYTALKRNGLEKSANAIKKMSPKQFYDFYINRDRVLVPYINEFYVQSRSALKMIDEELAQGISGW